MQTSISALFKRLETMLTTHIPPLQIRQQKDDLLEMAGTRPAMQGRKKVDGYYFASIVPKPKDVRLYFFPIYTHQTAFDLSPELQKCLKGKSCFHIRKLSPELEEEIRQMIQRGVELYQADGLI